MKKAERRRIDAFELWCWRRLLRVPWTARRSKGDQSWVLIGRTDAEAETPVLWPPHVKSWLIGEDPDAGRDWGHGENGMTEDEMAGWHHRLDGREFEWTPGVHDGQGGLRAVIHGVAKSQTWLSDWTDWLKYIKMLQIDRNWAYFQKMTVKAFGLSKLLKIQVRDFCKLDANPWCYLKLDTEWVVSLFYIFNKH